jgi:hypothetical protein
LNAGLDPVAFENLAVATELHAEVRAFFGPFSCFAVEEYSNVLWHSASETGSVQASELCVGQGVSGEKTISGHSFPKSDMLIRIDLRKPWYSGGEIWQPTCGVAHLRL